MIILEQLFNSPALPEIVLLGTIVVILFIEAFVKQSHSLVTYSTAQLGLLLSLFFVFRLSPLPVHLLFNQQFIWDPVAYLIKIALLIISLFPSFMRVVFFLKKANASGEYYVLGLFSILGMLVLSSANSLISLYLGLELVSFPLYALVALYHLNNSAEAAMKYFILGALASGLFLYGLSLLYGATHSVVLIQISQALLGNDPAPLILLVGLVFVIAGIAFKLGAAPFQLWVPDVYQGATIPVTLFIGAAPKIAALALAIRLLVDALPSLHLQWQALLALVATFSFIVGNLVAIVQTNLKRMLAYSAIAHMGYALLGFVAGTASGYAMSVFYMLIYGLMALGAFGLLVVLSEKGNEVESIHDLRGLNARSPWLAFLMLLVMFSMAGIPPTAGFFAKIGILQVLIESHQLWLATLAIIFAIIGSYYYLNVVKVMYFEEPETTSPPLRIMSDAYLVLSINVILLLVLGLFPSQLIELSKATFLTISQPVY